MSIDDMPRWEQQQQRQQAREQDEAEVTRFSKYRCVRCNARLDHKTLRCLGCGWEEPIVYANGGEGYPI